MPPPHTIVDGQALPSLAPVGALFHRLSGALPEYEVEPRVLLEGNGYIKGCKVVHTTALSPTDAEGIIEILLNDNSYGDRGMGSRCFFPGFAFTFGATAEQAHVQVCLECSWVVFHTAAGSQSFVPSPTGEARLKAVYERLIA